MRIIFLFVCSCGSISTSGEFVMFQPFQPLITDKKGKLLQHWLGFCLNLFTQTKRWSLFLTIERNFGEDFENLTVIVYR